MHERLVKEWVETYGAATLPDGSAMPPEVVLPEHYIVGHQTTADDLSTKQKTFIKAQFHQALVEVFENEDNAAKCFAYFKVLCAWLVALDTRLLLETLTQLIENGSWGGNTQGESCISLFQTVLCSLFVLPDISAIVSDIDDLKPSTHLPATTAVETAILRYALGDIPNHMLSMMFLGPG